jgi:hypothetical protein
MNLVFESSYRILTKLLLPPILSEDGLILISCVGRPMKCSVNLSPSTKRAEMALNPRRMYSRVAI